MNAPQRRQAKRPTEGSPGDLEIQTLCEQARLVARVCDLLGYEFRGAGPFLRDLEHELLIGRTHVHLEEDGAWILPELVEED